MCHTIWKVCFQVREEARGLEARAGWAGWATLVGPSVAWRLGLAGLVCDGLAGLAGLIRVGGLAGREECDSNAPMLERLAAWAGWLLVDG